MTTNIGNFNYQGLETKTREAYRQDVQEIVDTPRSPEVQAGLDAISETIGRHAEEIGRRTAENLAKEPQED